METIKTRENRCSDIRWAWPSLSYAYTWASAQMEAYCQSVGAMEALPRLVSEEIMLLFCWSACEQDANISVRCVFNQNGGGKREDYLHIHESIRMVDQETGFFIQASPPTCVHLCGAVCETWTLMIVGDRSEEEEIENCEKSMCRRCFNSMYESMRFSTRKSSPRLKIRNLLARTQPRSLERGIDAFYPTGFRFPPSTSLYLKAHSAMDRRG